MTAADEARLRLAWQPAALLAVDPAGLGGAVLRGAGGPARDAWVAALKAALPPAVAWRRLPPGIAEDRLLGGLDLTATLTAGRPVAAPGLLAEADGGVLLVPTAERLGAAAAAHIGAALDRGETIVERDGLAWRASARFAAVLLDEGLDDERAPQALAARLAFSIDLDGLAGTFRHAMKLAPPDIAAIVAARARLPGIAVDAETIEAICATGLAFGVPSLGVAMLVLRAAKAAAALAGRDAVSGDDVELASALVIAPRATALPSAETAEPDADEPESDEDSSPEESSTDLETPADASDDTNTGAGDETAEALADRVVEAVRAAIPAGLLAELGLAARPARRETPGGRAGSPRQNEKRGRPAGVRRGSPDKGARLALVDTLRAAAPWQRLRRAQQASAPSRILVRREDFRIARLKARSEAVTIFAVDASGSAALHRLAEVKGAVELILAQCYVRRDQVALIAFRGTGAELILPPTRSLARAKRALAGQPGGGGTPLAAAIDAAAAPADGVRRKGLTPLVVVMTDGKANIDRAGRPGRAEADADATVAARRFRAGGVAGLVLDVAPRPAEPARRLAIEMGARYMPLPYADAQVLSRAVLAAGSTN